MMFCVLRNRHAIFDAEQVEMSVKLLENFKDSVQLVFSMN